MAKNKLTANMNVLASSRISWSVRPSLLISKSKSNSAKRCLAARNQKAICKAQARGEFFFCTYFCWTRVYFLSLAQHFHSSAPSWQVPFFGFQLSILRTIRLYSNKFTGSVKCLLSMENRFLWTAVAN